MLAHQNEHQRDQFNSILTSASPKQRDVVRVKAQPATCTAIDISVSRAEETTLGFRHILRGETPFGIREIELVAAPAFLTILDTGPSVVETLAQAQLDCHVLSVIVDLVIQKATIGGLRHT